MKVPCGAELGCGASGRPPSLNIQEPPASVQSVTTTADTADSRRDDFGLVLVSRSCWERDPKKTFIRSMFIVLLIMITTAAANYSVSFLAWVLLLDARVFVP